MTSAAYSLNVRYGFRKGLSALSKPREYAETDELSHELLLLYKLLQLLRICSAI